MGNTNERFSDCVNKDPNGNCPPRGVVSSCNSMGNNAVPMWSSDNGNWVCTTDKNQCASGTQKYGYVFKGNTYHSPGYTKTYTKTHPKSVVAGPANYCVNNGKVIQGFSNVEPFEGFRN